MRSFIARLLALFIVRRRYVTEWAHRQLHEANAIARVMRGNPLLSEAAGNVSESGGKQP